MVLAAVVPGGTSTLALTQTLGLPAETIRAAVSRLVQSGLVEANGDFITVTENGRLAATHVRRSLPAATAGVQVPTIDLNEVARFIGSLWPMKAESAAERERDGLLASHADRDSVVHQLSDAFSQGRLSSGEFEERTSKALTARTYGDLDDVLEGLGGLQRQTRSHPVRKSVFWGVALLSSPLLLLGAMLLAFGVDPGDRVGGIFFLVLLLPGLFALRRWAWPRA